MALKHVGRIVNNQRKIVVAYRVVPNEEESCIVVTTENLMAEEHDALMKAVESSAGQESYEFGEAMARNTLPDGRNMLAGFHTTGKMMKMKQSEIEMTPDRHTTINLADLNKMIAEQKGVSIEDLALKDSTNSTPAKKVEEVNTASADVMSDEDLAASYRSQADALFKEAKALREQAESLVPTKRKKKVEEGA